MENKYIVNLTGRDGSSRFGREDNLQNFGARTCMEFFEEPFIKSGLAFISFGKLEPVMERREMIRSVIISFSILIPQILSYQVQQASINTIV